MPSTEQEYKDHIRELEQQVRLLKEQVDFLTRKLYGTRSEKTSVLLIEGQMSLFDEIENNADPNAAEPSLIEVEKHLRKRKYAGQKAELIKDLPRIFHTRRSSIPSMKARWYAKSAAVPWCVSVKNSSGQKSSLSLHGLR